MNNAIPASGAKIETSTQRVATVSLITFAIVVAHNLLHEGGHALAAKALGYDVIARINHVTTAGVMGSDAHALLISAAGPVVTIVIAAAAWWFAPRQRLTLTIVGAALAMRLVAAAVSMFYPNDEARLSLGLGLGKWTVFVVVIAALLALFISLWRRAQPAWRWWMGSYVGASSGFAFNVYAEPFLPALSF